MVAVKLKGEAELRARLRAAAKADFKAANLEAAEVVKGDAVSRAPVLSGRLQGSIRAAATAKAGIIRAGWRSVPYVGVIHFGWARHSITPNPFLYDALDARRDEVLEVYEKRVQALADQVNQ